MLGAYEERFPGAAERIMRMAEIPLEMAQAEQQHRQRLETRLLTSDNRRSWSGMVLGFLLVALVVILGFILVLRGYSVQGMAALIGPLAGLGAIFVYVEHRRGNAS